MEGFARLYSPSVRDGTRPLNFGRQSAPYWPLIFDRLLQWITAVVGLFCKLSGTAIIGI